jgi:hypothetical protein
MGAFYRNPAPENSFSPLQRRTATGGGESAITKALAIDGR